MRILIVEDDTALRGLLERHFSYWGWTCTTAGTGQEGVDHLRLSQVDAVLTDLALPDMTGLTLATVASYSAPSAAVIVISGVPGADKWGIVGGAQNIAGLFRKPFRFDDLRIFVEHQVRLRGTKIA